jgi:hypothetical protein
MVDVIDQEGDKMVPKFGKIFQFGILDETDTEVPITIDFKNGKGDIYLGSPKANDDDNLACKVKLKESDFHKILDG